MIDTLAVVLIVAGALTAWAAVRGYSLSDVLGFIRG